MTELRPEVLRFAEAMQAKMEAIENRVPPRHKRGDWITEPFGHLWDHLEEELAELAEAKHLSRVKTADELIDVANMCAFIWNRFGIEESNNPAEYGWQEPWVARAEATAAPGPGDDQRRSLDP